MKVLLLGVFTPESTDSWKLRALNRLGHRVLPWPYRDRDWRELHALGEPWDLAFVSKGVPLPAEAFARLAEISKARLLWWPDPFENWTETLSEVLRTGTWALSATSDVVIAKILLAVGRQHVEGWDSLPLLSRVTGAPVARILEGCDCEGPRPDWAPAQVKPALLHFGHLSERRVQVIERLRAAGIQVDHLDRPLYGAALQRKVLEYAAVLGINTSPDLYSNRVQTVLAMGGRMLQEEAPGIESRPGDFAAVDAADFTCPMGIFPGSLHLWCDEEELVHEARNLPWLASGMASSEQALRIFEHFRWERVMERALRFACPTGDQT